MVTRYGFIPLATYAIARTCFTSARHKTLGTNAKHSPRNRGVVCHATSTLYAKGFVYPPKRQAEATQVFLFTFIRGLFIVAHLKGVGHQEG